MDSECIKFLIPKIESKQEKKCIFVQGIRLQDTKFLFYFKFIFHLFIFFFIIDYRFYY